MSDVSRRWQHPWVRIALLIRELMGTRWGTTWPRAKAVLGDALRERSRIRRAGWFNFMRERPTSVRLDRAGVVHCQEGVA